MLHRSHRPDRVRISQWAPVSAAAGLPPSLLTAEASMLASPPKPRRGSNWADVTEGSPRSTSGWSPLTLTEPSTDTAGRGGHWTRVQGPDL